MTAKEVAEMAQVVSRALLDARIEALEWATQAIQKKDYYSPADGCIACSPLRDEIIRLRAEREKLT
mgnify:CR=1 FL=1